MFIISICCAYNISMSVAKFSMTVNRILHIFVSKKDSDASCSPESFCSWITH